MQYIHEFRKLLFMPSELTFGTEYSYDDLGDRSIGYDIHTDQTSYISWISARTGGRPGSGRCLSAAASAQHNLVDRA